LHTMRGTSANVNDVVEANSLLPTARRPINPPNLSPHPF
jgi:hypothetical protein